MIDVLFNSAINSANMFYYRFAHDECLHMQLRSVTGSWQMSCLSGTRSCDHITSTSLTHYIKIVSMMSHFSSSPAVTWINLSFTPVSSIISDLTLCDSFCLATWNIVLTHVTRFAPVLCIHWELKAQQVESWPELFCFQRRQRHWPWAMQRLITLPRADLSSLIGYSRKFSLNRSVMNHMAVWSDTSCFTSKRCILQRKSLEAYGKYLAHMKNDLHPFSHSGKGNGDRISDDSSVSRVKTTTDVQKAISFFVIFVCHFQYKYQSILKSRSIYLRSKMT